MFAETEKKKYPVIYVESQGTLTTEYNLKREEQSFNHTLLFQNLIKIDSN